jgi:hypothetical protein
MAVVGTPHKISKQAAKSLPTPHLPFIFTVLYNNGGHLRKRRSQNSEVQFKLIAQANKLASLGVTREGRVTPGERSGRGQSDRSYTLNFPRLVACPHTSSYLVTAHQASPTSTSPIPLFTLGSELRSSTDQDQRSPQPTRFTYMHLRGKGKFITKLVEF